MLHIHQVNLQRAVGGGEVYTRGFTRALADAGARVTLYVHPDNRFWDGLQDDRVRLRTVPDPQALAALLPRRDALVMTQSPVPPSFIAQAAAEHVLTGFSHMPMLGRSAEGFRPYAEVFTVSRYCIGLLRAAGISQVWDEPVYGTFALERPPAGRLEATSPYLWDTRKVRDRLLALAEPALARLRPRRPYVARPGLTLGIVSLIAPIKQFPALFTLVAPHLARHPQVNLEVFGHGGYAQVRDLRRALAPLAGRVRYWGFQPSVQAVYPHLDYLLTGLPEKEALGLNVIEAQACGTPVLAPAAPPFTETVLDGRSGFLYRDPREDGGVAFGALLDSLVAGRTRPDPRVEAAERLQAFSYPALVGRAQRILAHLAARHPRAARATQATDGASA